MEAVDCIFCGCAPTTLYAKENGYQAVQCTGCGLVFVSPRPSIDEMKKLYEGQETKVNLYRHLSRRDAKVAEARRALGVIRQHRPTGRLLEIGSAAGYFLWEAKQQGFQVQGIDITRQFVEFSERVLGVPAYEGTLRDAPFERESFDIVYHRNVLSHLSWPLREFQIIASLLRPGGVLVFETGNVAELPPGAAGELELPDHLYHFSEATIVKLLERTGFSWLETQRHVLVDAIPWVRAALAALSCLHGTKTGQSSSSNSRPLPDSFPRSRALSRCEAEINQIIRYDVGRRLAPHGRKCTLVVVAQRST